ncbi:MAG: tetratricopeptide repeat protein [Pyrinomonadaceae bacterium]
MRKTILVVLAALSVAVGVKAQTCAEGAKEIAPVMSQETLQKYEKQLDDARLIATTGPNGGDVDSIIWYGRRTAYLGKYKDAIGIFTRAIKRWPDDARLYRHRGHRYITLRCFDDAIADLEKAAKLVKGKPDVVEPDGIPNAKNIPTSTLQSNIWYHLGLAYYLKGDMKKAAFAYSECMKVSKNNDMLAATSHWFYMTLRRSERNGEAAKLLLPFDGDFELIENDDYLKLLRLYRGEIRPDTLENELGEKAETLGNASLGYGFGNWYLYNGDTSKAIVIFKKITAGNQWSSFGYIAAEAELKRLSKP